MMTAKRQSVFIPVGTDHKMCVVRVDDIFMSLLHSIGNGERGSEHPQGHTYFAMLSWYRVQTVLVYYMLIFCSMCHVGQRTCRVSFLKSCFLLSEGFFTE